MIITTVSSQPRKDESDRKHFLKKCCLIEARSESHDAEGETEEQVLVFLWIK